MYASRKKKSGNFLYAAFIDFRKAFDSVWRKGLLFKLQNIGVTGNFYNIIKTMYEDVTYKVKLPSNLSQSFTTSCGVKQGCNLSPTLFNIFVNDFPDSLGEVSDHPIDIDGIKLNCILYADDLMLISETAEGLQNCLNKLDSYCQQWSHSVNISKTSTINKSKNSLI